MCVYEVSYVWAKYAAGEESGLFFKRTFSVLNHLPAFGGYFFYSSECFCRNALMCSLILAVSAWEKSVKFPFFQGPSSVFCLVPFYSQSSDHFCYSSIHVFLRDCAHDPRCSRGFLNIFWAKLSCTRDEFIHDATWWNFVHALNKCNICFKRFKRHNDRQIISINVNIVWRSIYRCIINRIYIKYTAHCNKGT